MRGQQTNVPSRRDIQNTQRGVNRECTSLQSFSALVTIYSTFVYHLGGLSGCMRLSKPVEHTQNQAHNVNMRLTTSVYSNYKAHLSSAVQVRHHVTCDISCKACTSIQASPHTLVAMTPSLSSSAKCLMKSNSSSLCFLLEPTQLRCS